jgi:hypothetical protein
VSIKEAFVARLKASAAVQSVAGGRVYPQQAPELQAPPYLTYFAKDASSPAETLDDEGGWGRQVFQVDCWGLLSSDVDALAEAVRNRFGLKAANVGAWNYSGGSVWVHRTACEDNSDDFAPPAFSDEAGIYAVSLNVPVTFDKPLPTGS